MKRALLIDLLTVKDLLAQSLLMFVFVGVFVGIGVGNTIGVAAAISSMSTLMLYLTISSYDEINLWQRYRASLPLSRRQLMFGRYASVLVMGLGGVVFSFIVSCLISLASGIAPFSTFITAINENALVTLGFEENPPIAILCAALMGTGIGLLFPALVQPFVAKYGMTKGVRLAPILTVFLLVGVLAVSDSLFDASMIARFVAWADANFVVSLVLITSVVMAVVLAAFAASAFFAGKIYEKRDL